MTTEEKKDVKEAPVYHKVTTPERYPDDEKKPEQSETSHLLEHHLKLQQLERKVSYLQGEIDGMEARRRERQKTALIIVAAFCYGLAVAFLFDL